MARFCSKCGTQLSEGMRFCLNCGAPVPDTDTAPPVPTAPVAQPPAPEQTASVPPPIQAAPAVQAASAAPSSGSNTWIKVVVGILLFFVLLGVLGIGACLYIGYRVKKKAIEMKQSYGIDMGTHSSANDSRDVCTLVTKEEVSQALGSPIETAENEGSKSNCLFRGPTGSNTQVEVRITWQGGKLAMKLAGVGMTAVAGRNLTNKIDGLGDEAVEMPMGSMLMVRKGDVLIEIDMRMAQNNTAAAKVIAQRILDRL